MAAGDTPSETPIYEFEFGVGVGLPANLSDKACAAAEALAKAGEWSFEFLLVKTEVKALGPGIVGEFSGSVLVW